MVPSHPMEIIDLTGNEHDIVDLTEGEVIDLTEDLDQDNGPVFTIFPNLPIELHIKIWEHAFPTRVVNLTYDQYNDRFHSFNSTPPLLLKIHHESRELALRQYTLCFGTESHEPRIYFDFNRDILLFDDYLQFYKAPTLAVFQALKQPQYYQDQLQYQEYPITDKERDQIQRVALNWSAFFEPSSIFQDMNHNQWSRMSLQQIAQPIAARFSSLREMSFLVEEINPFAKAHIKLFNLGSERCSPICDVCYNSARCQVPIQHLRTAFGEKIKIRLLGAFRGSSHSHFDLGCYDKAVEKTAGDDVWDYGLNHEPLDDFEDPFSYEDGFGELEEYGEERESYLKADVYPEDVFYDTDEDLLLGDDDEDAETVIS
jgi:hypothetical protein